MKISKEEAVYAVLKMVADDKISLHMIYNGLWLFNLLEGLGLATPEVIDANLEIKETILNCLKEEFKNVEKILDISGNKRIIDNVRNIQKQQSNQTESEENKMTFISLYSVNAEWLTFTELNITFIHEGKPVQISGEALDMAIKYSNFKVISFLKNSVILKEAE